MRKVPPFVKSGHIWLDNFNFVVAYKIIILCASDPHPPLIFNAKYLWNYNAFFSKQYLDAIGPFSYVSSHIKVNNIN